MTRRYQIHYGEEEIALDLPPANVVFELRPRKCDIPAHQAALLREAIQHPIGTGRLSEIVPPGASVVVLVDDRTRLTPQRLIVPVVLEELNRAGVPDERIRLLIAYGTHRPMTDQEIVERFGEEIVRRVGVLHHECRNRERLVDRGTTRRGTRIWINRDYIEADFRIGVGAVLPHHPVGWSGGAKILLPGVAGQDTVCAMHLLGATEQQLGNILTPCREEMEDFARDVGLQFIVNVVFDQDGGVYKCAAGHFIAAHREAVKWGFEIFGAEFGRKADITLSSTFPADYDLSQSDKGLFSAERCTEPGGEIILVSPCPEGIAPTHGEEMARLAAFDDEKLWQLLREDRLDDRFCAAECMYLNHIKRHFKATLMMDALTSNLMGFHYLSRDDLPRYLRRRLELDPGLKIGLVHQAGEVLPMAKARAAPTSRPPTQPP